MPSAEPRLLSDDQVRRFITDGYLILSPDVAASVHERIDERLLWMMHKESNPGNNVLPMVPEMYDVLNSPVVSGALASILGSDYVLHPHRFVHNNEPGKIEDGAAKVGAGSASFVGWHQDSHSPLSRPRHHYPRYAMILYYPQDTPVELGPTQIIPATQLSRSFSDADRARGIQASGPAGACVLTHFDIVHGGSLNISDRTRNMAKFVFARCSEPAAPTWDNCAAEWIPPVGHLSPVENNTLWRHQWAWMAGRTQCGPREPAVPLNAVDTQAAIAALQSGSTQQQVDAVNKLALSGRPDAISILISQLSAHEPVRQAAIYALALVGAKAVKPLLDMLESVALQTAPESFETGWNESAVVMESAAYALAAIGSPAVAELTDLLNSCSEWVRINAAFALGEIGPRAGGAIPALIGLLNDESHPVVRTALDAIGQIRVDGQAALPEIRRLLAAPNNSFPQSWVQEQRRKWTGLGQVRINAVMALLRMGDEAHCAAEWLGDYLDDDCGYVGGFGIEFLLRHKTAAAQSAAIDYLYRHRWDSSLHGGVRTF